MDALAKLLFFAQLKSNSNQISDCDLPYSYFTQTYVIYCNPIAPRNSLYFYFHLSLSPSRLLLSSLSCEALRSICSMRNLEGSLSCHVVAWCKSKSILWSTQIRGLTDTHTHTCTYTDRHSKFACDKPRGNNPLPLGTGRTLRIRQKLKMLQICNPYSKDVEFFTYRCGAIQTEYTHTHKHTDKATSTPVLSLLHPPADPPCALHTYLSFTFCEFFFLLLLLSLLLFFLSIFMPSFFIYATMLAISYLSSPPAGRLDKDIGTERGRGREKGEGNWEQEPTNL